MKTYIRKKLMGLLPFLSILSVAAFLLVRLMPGDAATAYLASINAPVTEASLAKVRQDLGLDGPLLFQYLTWLKQVLHLELGVSYMTKKPVLSQLLMSFRYTLLLTAASLLWIAAASLFFGIVAGRRPGGPADWLIRGFTFLGSSMPSFWLGFLLVELFSLKLKLLPVQGAGSSLHLVLPSFTLAGSYIAMYTKMIRGGIVENSQKAHVLYGRVRGLPEGTLLWHHMLPASLVPVLTSLGLSMGSMLSGSVIVENVFAWPGMGRLIVTAVTGRDYPVIQGYILLIAVLYTLLNLLVDLLCALIDPQLCLDGEDLDGEKKGDAGR